MLVDGVTVEYRRADGAIRGAQARVIDFDDPEQQRLARRQPVHRRRGPAQRAGRTSCLRQRPAARRDRAEERRRRERDDLDAPSTSSRPTRRRSRRCSPTTRCWSSRTASQARIGSLGAGQGVVQALAHDRRARRCAAATCRSCRWCSKACSSSAASSTWSAHFVVFEDDGGGKLVKKMAGYHQFHAVNVAVEETLRRRCERDRGGSAGRTRRGSPAASRATGASAWSGTRRARARA